MYDSLDEIMLNPAVFSVKIEIKWDENSYFSGRVIEYYASGSETIIQVNKKDTIGEVMKALEEKARILIGE